MPFIRQGSLFDLQELYDLELTQRFEAIFSDIDPIYAVVKKKSRLGSSIMSVSAQDNVRKFILIL